MLKGKEPRKTSNTKILSSKTSNAKFLFLRVMVNDPSRHYCRTHHMASKHHCPIPNLPMSFKGEHHFYIGITEFLQELQRRKNSSDPQPGNSDPPTPPTPPAPFFGACFWRLFGSQHLLIFIDGFQLYRSITCISFQSVDLNLLGHEIDK